MNNGPDKCAGSSATKGNAAKRVMGCYKMATFGEKIRLEARKLLNLWRARRDLNPQPSDPKSDALSS